MVLMLGSVLPANAYLERELPDLDACTFEEDVGKSRIPSKCFKLPQHIEKGFGNSQLCNCDQFSSERHNGKGIRALENQVNLCRSLVQIILSALGCLLNLLASARSKMALGLSTDGVKTEQHAGSAPYLPKQSMTVCVPEKKSRLITTFRGMQTNRSNCEHIWGLNHHLHRTLHDQGNAERGHSMLWCHCGASRTRMQPLSDESLPGN